MKEETNTIITTMRTGTSAAADRYAPLKSDR